MCYFENSHRRRWCGTDIRSVARSLTSGAIFSKLEKYISLYWELLFIWVCFFCNSNVSLYGNSFLREKETSSIRKLFLKM